MDINKRDRAERDFVLYDCLSDPLYLLFLDKWRVLWCGREAIDPKRVYYHVVIDNDLDIFGDEQPIDVQERRVSVLSTESRTNIRKTSSVEDYFKKKEILEKAQECLDLVTQITKEDSTISRVLKIKNGIINIFRSSIEKRIGTLNSSNIEIITLTGFITFCSTILLMFSHSSTMLKIITNVGFYIVTLFHKINNFGKKHPQMPQNNEFINVAMKTRNSDVTSQNLSVNNMNIANMINQNTYMNRNKKSNFIMSSSNRIESSWRNSFSGENLYRVSPSVQTQSVDNNDEHEEIKNEIFRESNDFYLFLSIIVNLGTYSVCSSAPMMTTLLISLLDILRYLYKDLPDLRKKYRVNDLIGRFINKLISKQHVVDLFITKAKRELLIFPLLEALLRSLTNPMMAFRTCIILCSLKLGGKADPDLKEAISEGLSDIKALEISILTLLVDILEDIIF